MRELKQKWDKYTEGPFGIIIYLFLGFVIAYGTNIALGIVLNTNTPVVAVFSNSMVPTFYRGDMIIVYGDRDIKIGDIVVFDISDMSYPIIHRVYSVSDGSVLTKGDHNSSPGPPAPDGKVSLNNVHGKAILKIPLLGWVKILFVSLTGIG